MNSLMVTVYAMEHVMMTVTVEAMDEPQKVTMYAMVTEMMTVDPVEYAMVTEMMTVSAMVLVSFHPLYIYVMFYIIKLFYLFYFL